MIIDSSAIIAIVRREPEADDYLDLVNTSSCRMSAASYFEASIVVDSAREPAFSRAFDDLIHDAEIAIEAVSLEQAHIARQAYRDYGRGSGHPARLNFGDCFAYALARTTREALLFKGNDFAHTDLLAAVQSTDGE